MAWRTPSRAAMSRVTAESGSAAREQARAQHVDREVPVAEPEPRLAAQLVQRSP